MPDFKFHPRVWETTTTTGTGPLTLVGVSTAEKGLITFAGAGYSTTVKFIYIVSHRTLDEWEFGMGYLDTTLIQRLKVFESSNSDALVAFSAGTKDVFLLDYPGFGGLVSTSSNITLDSSQEIVLASSSSDQTVTIPSASSFIGKKYTIVKTGTSGTVTIARSGSDVFFHPYHGFTETSLTLPTVGGSVTLIANGTATWIVIADTDHLAIKSEISITGSTTLTSAAFGRTHLISGTAANYSINLPAVSSSTGKTITFRVAPIASATRWYTLDGNASETINGSLTRLMWADEVACLFCTGAEWVKLWGRSIPVSCILRRTSAQTIAANTWTHIATTTRVEDNTQSMAVPFGNLTSGRAEVVRPGDYLGSGFGSIGGVTVGKEFNAGVSRNNASPQDNPNAFGTVSIPSSGAGQMSGTGKFVCANGDWIGTICFHDDIPNNRNTRAVGTVYPTLSVTELNPW
jgi:hypothetical protein